MAIIPIPTSVMRISVAALTVAVALVGTSAPASTHVSSLLTLLPASPVPSMHSIGLGSSMLGDQIQVGTVNLRAPAGAGGVTVTLSTNQPGLEVPATVVVPAGATSATFVAKSADVSLATSVNLTASTIYNSMTRTIRIKTLPPAAVILSADTAKGGSVLAGKVTIAGPAANDVVLDLGTSNDLVGVPAHVTIFANTSSATFAVGTGVTTKMKKVKVLGTLHGMSKSQSLVVVP